MSPVPPPLATGTTGTAAHHGTPLVPTRIAALDGLRAIAILLVVAGHYCASVPIPAGATGLDWLRRVTSLGYSGVDLFFVLSGFLIGGILLDQRAAPRLLPAFYARRFFRIVPLYLLLLASFFAGREIPGLGAINRGTYFVSAVPLGTYFCFGQNIAMAWTQDIGPYWLGVTWSLAIEEQFYLVAPLFIRRFSRRPVMWACLVVIGLSPLLRLMALYHAQNACAAVFLLLTRADGLMWGVVCACLMRDEATRVALRRHGALLATLIAAGGVFFAIASLQRLGADSPPMLTWGYSLLSAWFAAMVLGVLIFPTAAVTRRLGWRPLAAIGITSYFIYLFHTPIWYLLHWFFFHLPPLHVRWQAGAVTLLALAVTFAAAAVSWRWLERPLLKIGHRVSYE
jgi:peptidoglycan/LPS O-acetylase OafA/YrhL